MAIEEDVPPVANPLPLGLGDRAHAETAGRGAPIVGLHDLKVHRLGDLLTTPLCCEIRSFSDRSREQRERTPSRSSRVGTRVETHIPRREIVEPGARTPAKSRADWSRSGRTLLSGSQNARLKLLSSRSNRLLALVHNKGFSKWGIRIEVQ